MDQLPGSMTSPSGRVQRREAVRHMQAALAGLPEGQREYYGGASLLGQSLDEIARPRPDAAVRGLCFRGRQNLRRDGPVVFVFQPLSMLAGSVATDVNHLLEPFPHRQPTGEDSPGGVDVVRQRAEGV
jgi:hypothetical protein